MRHLTLWLKQIIFMNINSKLLLHSCKRTKMREMWQKWTIWTNETKSKRLLSWCPLFGCLCVKACATDPQNYSVFPFFLWPSLSSFPLGRKNISLPAHIKTKFSFCLSPFKSAQLFLNCLQIRFRLSARIVAVRRCRSPVLISLLRRLLTSGALAAHSQMTVMISAGARDESASLEKNSLCEQWHQHFL